MHALLLHRRVPSLHVTLQLSTLPSQCWTHRANALWIWKPAFGHCEGLHLFVACLFVWFCFPWPNVSVHQQWKQLHEIAQKNLRSGLVFSLSGVCEGRGTKPEGNCTGPAIRWTPGDREGEFLTETFCTQRLLRTPAAPLPIVVPKHHFLPILSKLSAREASWKCRKLREQTAGNGELKLI